MSRDEQRCDGEARGVDPHRVGRADRGCQRGADRGPDHLRGGRERGQHAVRTGELRRTDEARQRAEHSGIAEDEARGREERDDVDLRDREHTRGRRDRDRRHRARPSARLPPTMSRRRSKRSATGPSDEPEQEVRHSPETGDQRCLRGRVGALEDEDRQYHTRAPRSRSRRCPRPSPNARTRATAGASGRHSRPIDDRTDAWSSQSSILRWSGPGGARRSRCDAPM